MENLTWLTSLGWLRALGWLKALGWLFAVCLINAVPTASFAGDTAQILQERPQSSTPNGTPSKTPTVVPSETVLGGADQDSPNIPFAPLSPFGSCTLQLDGPPKCWAAVIMGRMAYPRDAPWQAQIFGTSGRTEYSAQTLQDYPLWELNHQCGGALISTDWIITAAHCVVDPMFNKRTSKIRLGALDISVQDGASFSIDRVVVHQGYDPRTRLNDIALVKIKGAENFNRDRNGNVMIVQLHGAHNVGPPLRDWHVFQVSGWGATSPGADSHASSRLKVLEVSRVPNDLCGRALRGGLTRIDASVICAAAEKGDACQGDSGGPLTLTTADNRGGDIPILVGIVSWGRGCAIKGNPGVYTRISAHLSWIRRAMATDANVVTLR